MIAALLALAAAVGTYWTYTAVSLGWRGLGFGPPISSRSRRRPRQPDPWMVQAGLVGVDKRQFAAVVATLGTVGGVVAYALFGGLVSASVAGLFTASFPVAAFRARRRARRQLAQEAWPQMIEEIRVQTTSLGRSIPQALFDVGRRGPSELRPAFDSAHREWLLTTDLARTLKVLKDALADPTADMACETLLLAHELGGTDLDRRLQELAEDRRRDVQGRKEARSRQAGARFARMFVLAVPLGMALAGMSIGNGRDAYRTTSGQAVVLVALSLVIGCWMWARQVMRIPEPQRVFDR